MEIKYIQRNDVTEAQQKMIDLVTKACFPTLDIQAIIDSKEEGHCFGAIEIGLYLLYDDDKIVGHVYVYKRLSEYDGQEFYIGGLGGLAIAPEYHGKGYAFLNRDAYYIDSLGKERVMDGVMIMGLNNKGLVEKILNTKHKFHYGYEDGYW